MKAKGRAAEQYMTNTGLPFILLQESADGIFNRYSTQETFDQFLIRASQSELKSFDKAERQDGIPQDLSWMSTLGLSDEQIESTDNE